MRLQTEGAPNPADRHAAEAGGSGQTARAPMRLGARRTFQGPNHNLLDLSIGDLAGRSRSRLVIKSFQASFQKSGAPLADHAQRGTHFPRHRFVVESLSAGQHQSRAPSQERLAARPSARGLIVNMSDVLLDTGKYSLMLGAREKLAKVAGIL